MSELVEKWVKNDWFSTTLILSCKKCDNPIFHKVYTIHMTEKYMGTEAKMQKKNFSSETCPFCGKKLNKR